MNRRSSRHARRLWWAVAAGGLVLTACGGGDSTSTAATEPATVPLTPELDAPLATAAVSPAPQGTENGDTTTADVGGPSVTGTAGATSTTAPPAPSTSRAATTTTEPPEPKTSCTSVIHVGDSTSVSLISPSYLSDPEQRVDAQYRRVGALDARTEIDGALSTRETLDGQANAYDRVVRIKESGYEGCWVFALGGNDTANVSAMSGSPSRVDRIERMMSAIGDDPVMWVNVVTQRTSGAYRNENMLLWNEALREVLPRHPNMRIFDWASAVQDQWFQDDAIHYTSTGSAWRAALIANALAANFPA